MALSPQGKGLASGAGGNTIRIGNGKTTITLADRDLPNHRPSVVFSPGWAADLAAILACRTAIGTVLREVR